MFIVVDPGETVGLAIFETKLRNQRLHLELLDAFEMPALTVASFAYEFYTKVLMPNRPVEVVIEDYRVYKDKADMHVGNRVFTSEVIGAVRGLCSIFIPQIAVVAYPANVKGSWPSARLDKYFPAHAEFAKLIHAHDCLQLGLYHAKEAQKWDPTTGVEWDG